MWPRMWWVCVVVGVVWWQTEVVSGQLDETKYRYASTLEYTILNTTDVYDVNNRCRCRRKCLEVEQCVGISIPRDPDNFQCKALVDANPGSVFINDSPDHDSFVKIYYMSSVTTTTTNAPTVGPVLLPAGGRDDAEWKCRKQGQTLAVLRTQQDLVNFLQQVPDTSGTYVHLALQYKRSHAFWTPRDEPFSTTELGQKPLPFDLDGKDFVLSSYSLAGKTIERFKRLNEHFNTYGVHCMNITGGFPPNYTNFVFSGVWQGYNYASGHCSNQNQELAVYKTEAEYQKLLTEAMPSKEDNFLALKYNSDNMRLEWDEPNIPIKVTPLAHLADLPITGNSGDCLYPKVNKTNPAAPFIASFTRDSCSEDGQAVCMDVPKIAEPGQVYKYEVRRTVVDHYSWFRPRREGYQLAILKTREQVDQVFNQISSDSPTLVNAVDDFLVALRWDSEAQELLWEDDTPYSSTPLASHSSTTDEPQDNKNHYLLHQKDGVYKGFRGKDNYDDTEYQLWMKLVP
ncbi:uncharacterized protein LOC121877016 [Homarus americanus]|uniref:uncharacterized protein LOC121877016 n=1 Tax=Homarus americanus TaxID=6706 RepID=UPI001C4901B1|nr:uncharacterized protein LOC121877016 [Homarus americanus]